MKKLNVLIEEYLKNLDSKLHSLDQDYVACTDKSEKNNVLNSEIIKGFLNKYKREFINFDTDFENVCKTFRKDNKKTRKEFYTKLFQKTIKLKDLEINL